MGEGSYFWEFNAQVYEPLLYLPADRWYENHNL